MLNVRLAGDHLHGRNTAQNRDHQRHHQLQPGEQQFPIQVVTSYFH